MSASISMKKKSLGMNFLKQTAGYISGGAKDYFESAMPVTTSTLSEAKRTTSAVSAAFINTSQSILPKVKQLKSQMNFRGITNWFMEREESYGDNGSDSGLNFDVTTDANDIAEAQISELGHNANQISSAVVASSHKMVESQLAATANLMATADKQTAVIAAGFDKTNETLTKILEVLTKNTSTLIETTVAANSKKSNNDSMVGNGKFNLSEYKKIIGGNFKNTEMGMLASFAPLLSGDSGLIKQMLTPGNVVSMFMGGALNKAAPNLKKNLGALDQVVNDTIMSSLIRLGNDRSYGTTGGLARMFGIDSSRKDTDTSRSSLELKTVPFDSIAHESITNAIPGYLRKILVAVGGEDSIYDYRSRSFRSKGSIKSEFRDTAANKGTVYGASGNVRKAVGTDDFSSMMYDMMMTELGSRTGGGSATRTVESFSNGSKAEDYIINTLLSKIKLSRQELDEAKRFAANLGKASSGTGGRDMITQASTNNVHRNNRMKSYVDNANAYNMDLSNINDGVEYDLDNIASSYGKQRKSSGSSANVRPSKSGSPSGVNYTNIALFEIYRKLNKGINVFQVGSNSRQSDPFMNYGEKYLQKPQSYRIKPIIENSSTRESIISRDTSGSGVADHSGEDNLLENGESENLSKGQRFGRWGKQRGGNLMRALFSGSPEQVKDAFGLMFHDVGQVAGKSIKNGASKLNEKSGNFTGYLKHKITGAGYNTGMKDEEGNDIQIAKNEKGGILKYFDELVFGDGGAKGLGKKISSSGSKWFKSIGSYFNYGGKDKDETKVAGKRKQILGTSVGAMLGMGLLGGPLGIIMGSVAGSAISQTDGIGAKLKNLLFGDKDHEGDKKKDKNKRRGLIGRAVDGIVDPIRFQIGKTMTSFGSVLKKNILGPLSNIGYAIKDRMSNAAGGVVSKVFGKIFGGAFGMLKKLVMLPLNIIKAPVTMLGGLARGAAEGGGAMAGGLLNSIASGIATKDGRTELKNRRKTQRRDANIDRAESGFYGDYEFDYEQDPNGPHGRMIKTSKKTSKGRDYKTWKAAEDARRDKMGTIDDFTSEHKMSKEEIEAAEAAKRTSENTSRIADDNSALRDAVIGEIIPGSSFKSHDEGVHDRLDKLLEFFNRKKKGSSPGNSVTIEGEDHESNKIASSISNSSEAGDIDSFASGAIGAAATFAGSGDVISSDESRLMGGIIDESQKNKASKQSIGSKLKDLMGAQKKKLDKATEKKETIFDKIFNFLGNTGDVLKSLLPLAGVIAALVALFKTGGLKDLLDRLGVGVEKFIGLIGGNDKDGQDPTTVGMNTVSSIADIQAESSWDYANPLSTLYHNQKDGAGNSIKNSSATEAKDELLWKMPLRKDLLGGTWNTLRAGSKLDLADTLDKKAMAQRASGGTWNNTKAKVNEMRSDRALRQSLDAESAASAPKTNTISSIGRAAGRIGVINVAGNMTGGIAGSIASGLGADEETSASVSRITNATTSGALTANVIKTTVVPGKKKAWVDTILDGVTNFFKWIAKKVGAEDIVKAAGSSKAVSGITKMASTVTGAIAGKFDDLVVNKIATRLAALGVGNAAAVATAGIAIAAGAVVGAIDGFCKTAHLFQVLPGEETGGMKTISTIMSSIIGAASMTPAGWIMVIFDVLDAILTAIPGIGKGITQMIAQFIYSICGGGAELSEKQGAMEADRQHLKETYGVDINTSTHNDEVNSSGMLDRMWNGKSSVGEDGFVVRDKAGVALKQGGMTGWYAGSEKKYATDNNGAVLRDENNKAIQAVDKHGNTIKEDMKWGDHVNNWASGVGRFFGGGDTYKSDINGQALIGPDGKPIVESTSGNVFQRGGSAVSDWWGGKEIMGLDGKMTKTKGFAEAAQQTLGNIGSTIAKPFQDAGSAVSKWWGGSEELDENGNPIQDENGNPVKKGGFKTWAKDGLGKFTSTAGNLIRGISSPVKELLLGDYERDENGNPCMDDNNQPIRKGGFAGWIKTTHGKFNSSFVEPAKELVNGAQSWAKENPDWFSNGVNSAGEWIKGKASSMWTSISEPVKDITNSAKSWLSDKANWLGDKAKGVGPWVHSKAFSMWKSISDPVKDASNSASEWVNKKGAWLSDKAKSTKEWMTTKIGNLFESITDNVKGLVNGAQSWAKEKSQWAKDGISDVGDWIGKQATSVWDWITNGIDKIANKGEQSKRDREYIQSKQSGGIGGVSRGYGGIGKMASGLHSASESAPVSTSTTPTGTMPSPFIGTGYNYSVPSDVASCDYGPRNLWGKPDYHTGIDLAPTSGDWSVGSISPAIVTKVDDSVPTTKGGKNYGNFVEYQMADGTKILNGHLAPNSIPTGIRPGTSLIPGDKIGTMGTTGNSSGNHLHFEARHDSITDKNGGHSFDPSSLIGMSTVSDTGNYTSDGSSSSSGIFGTENNNASISGNSDKSPLAILFDSLKNIGSRFLSLITGGLLGDSLAGSPSSTDSNAPTINYGDYSQYTGTCANVIEFLKMCANEIGTTESPANSNKTKYGEWYNWNGVAWCMIFVQWCFSQAGLALEHRSASCSDTLEWWTKNHPDRVTTNPKPGDIMIQEGHTGIVEKVNGSTVTTIEGNTSPTDKGSQNNGGCVARKERKLSSIKKFIRPVDFEALSQQVRSIGSMPADLGEGAEALWQYFKGLGYTDEAISGILGCWTSESKNKPRTIESEFLPGFPGYDRLINDRQAMNDYTQRVVFAKTKGVDQKAYKGNDGNLYPGIGLAQWTGTRGESLLKFAKQNNADWGTMGTQLGYLDTELNSGYKNVKGHIQGAKTPEEAAGIFCNEFEGYNGSGVSIRKTNARNLMAKYGGKTGVGGNSNISSTKRPTTKEFNELEKEYNIHTSSRGIGGTSSIAKTLFKSNIPQQIISLPRPSDSDLSPKVRTNENFNNIVTEKVYSGEGDDLSRVITLLTKIVSELIDINGNTGTSSNLLSSLNEKGFVDKGLRDSMTAVAKSQKNTAARHVQGNPNNVRTVAALARP